MTIAPGTRLGPYEIVSELSAISMGQVYRAKDARLGDARLGRDVAIKVIAPMLAADPESLRRFEHEARAASALNHPNIVTVYDVGSEGGVAYLAMELVEGKSLRELLAGGRLALPKTLDIGAQIAKGLAAAHSHGLVHRDLKPANIMVTRDGLVKILDFGLAKIVAPASLESGDMAPTLDRSVTTPGMILGTVGYMSPEQARGEPADFRSDQFSLGVILYEMASGRKAFDRGSVIDTLAAILRDEPSPLTADKNLPAPLCWLIERCLSKEPEGRYGSTRDLARDLEEIPKHIPPPAPVPPRPFWVLPLAILAAIAVGALAFQLWRRAPAPPVFEQLTFGRGSVWSGRFAPDGKTVVYAAAWDGGPFRLFRKGPESAASRKLEFPDANLLSVSRSGELAAAVRYRVVAPGGITFGVLAQAPLEGGAPREIARDVLFADWAPDGKSLAVVRLSGGKTVLEFPLGHVLYETNGFITYPRVSPSGDVVAFLDHPTRGDNSGTLSVVERSGARRTLAGKWAAVEGLAWHPRKKEIWVGGTHERQARAVWAVSLSGRERVVASAPGNLAVQDVAADGRLLVTRDTTPIGIMARGRGDAGERDLSWLDASFLTSLAADGSEILFTQFGRTVGAEYTGYLRRLDGANPMRLEDGYAQALSPDRSRVLSVASQAPPKLYVLSTGLKGAGPPTALTPRGLGALWWADWYPDGKRVVIAGAEPDKPWRLFACDPGTGQTRPLTPEGMHVDHFQGVPFSPDGKRFAAVLPNGRLAVFPAEGGEGQAIPELPVGQLPISWSEDGESLLAFDMYQSPAQVQRVSVSTGRREPWKQIALSDSAGVHGYPSIRVTADGTVYAYSYARFLSELYAVEGLD